VRASTFIPVVLCLLAASACGGDDAPADGGGGSGGGTCIDPVSRECDLAFPATYDRFYDELLGSTCAAGGASCHGPDGAMGGLVLADREMAHDYLLGNVDGRARVVPGDPECSPLVARIESDDPEFQMPPLAKLTAEQRCSIIQWIDMGAER